MKLRALYDAVNPKNERERFIRCREDIALYNTVSLRRVSRLGTMIGAALTFLSLPFIGVLHLLPAYLMLALFFTAVLLATYFVLPKHPSLTLPVYYVMMAFIMLLTIYMGTVLGKDTNATTFLLALLLLPLFLTDRPWRLISVNLLMTVIFIVAAECIKPRGGILSLDVANSIVVFVLSSAFIVTTVNRQLRTFENSLRERDELSKKNQLINAIPAGIAVFDVEDGKVNQVFTNDYFYRLFDDTREARAARTGGSFINSIHPDDRPRLANAIKSVIGGTDFLTLSCRSMKGDGSYMWVRFAASVDERRDGYIRVYSTYTSMEEEMKSREATQAKTEFLSRMSHDMRTPMNGILGLAELSEGETDVDVLHGNIKRITESGNYLLSLINDTLDFLRIESGRLSLDPRVVSTKDALAGILDVVKPLMEQKELRFSVVNEDNEPDRYVRLDLVRFKQIFINLLSNSAKFTPEGGSVTLSFALAGTNGSKSRWRARVVDNGIGMSEDFVKNRLFKPFSQENSAVSPQYTGSGLGLSIVRSLVLLMGGTIEVESVLGSGTTFTVYLELEDVGKAEADELRRAAGRELSHAETRLSGKRILLAEDHRLNAEIATRMLARVGCEVERACNGRECVDIFSRSGAEFDAVLMDVRMPVMDGIEAARAIRRLNTPDAARIPIIALTANAYENDIKNCLDAGMNAHLSKPIDIELLYQTLAECIGKSGQTEGV